MPSDAATAVPAEPVLRFVVVGHVDHGKSTLIGRLLHETDSLPEGKFEELEAISRRRGMPLEWSFVLDALQAERDQAVTIDTTQIWFHTPRRPYVIIDAPGHREFLKNMISGAALAEAALLVVDASEGVREQTRRHAYLLRLLGLHQVVVAVNKLDLVDFSSDRFDAVYNEVTAYLDQIGIHPSAVVPISARDGDNLTTASPRTPWYQGVSVLGALDAFTPIAPPVGRPLRFPVQDVYKFDHRRIIAGRLETGTLSVGDTLLFSPHNRAAKVKSIECWNAPGAVASAKAGQSVGITLDEQIFVERGDIASHDETPPVLTNVFRMTLFWLSDRPLEVGGSYRLKLATATIDAVVEGVERVIDTDTLGNRHDQQVTRNAVAEVVVRTRGMVALDEYTANPATGRAVLIDAYDTVGGGVINMQGYADQRRAHIVRATNITSVEHLLTPTARAARNGHTGGVIWFTGLSGAGKSTLAMEVERVLFRRGRQVYVLDGDNVRHGLCADLGFSPEERAENIRRVGEVAALFAQAGMVVITAFISPYRIDRERARSAAGEDFHEVYIHADVDTCVSRDPKGLYRKAQAGLITDFTGVSAPYEPPASPELHVDTVTQDVAQCVSEIVDYVETVTRRGI